MLGLFACLSVQAGWGEEDNISIAKQGKDSCTYSLDYSEAVVRKHFYGDWKPISREEKETFPDSLKIQDGNILIPAWYDRSKILGLRVWELSPSFSAAWSQYIPEDDAKGESWQFFFLSPDAGIAARMQPTGHKEAAFTANIRFRVGQAPPADNNSKLAPDRLDSVILVFDTSRGIQWGNLEAEKGWQVGKDEEGLYALFFRDNKTNEPVWFSHRQQIMYYHKTGANTACVTLLSKEQMDKVEKGEVMSAEEYIDEYFIDFQLIFTKPDAGVLQWSSGNYSGLFFDIFIPFKLQPVKNVAPAKNEGQSREQEI